MQEIEWALFRFTKNPRSFAFVGWVKATDWGRAHGTARETHPDLFRRTPTYPLGRAILRAKPDLPKHPYLQDALSKWMLIP